MLPKDDGGADMWGLTWQVPRDQINHLPNVVLLNNDIHHVPSKPVLQAHGRPHHPNTFNMENLKPRKARCT